ncbi:hypothetical protein EYC84_004162 [Monilinia fructicola]|uniref:Uncharacterized protein n=1 Tax=Monilinia fructicola TaxID=38448 RepID=A0A5M9K437_MONFR|nr:hypothetical protein EYC84_004162 [Monilinia fructicola]
MYGLSRLVDWWSLNKREGFEVAVGGLELDWGWISSFLHCIHLVHISYIITTPQYSHPLSQMQSSNTFPPITLFLYTISIPILFYTVHLLTIERSIKLLRSLYDYFLQSFLLSCGISDVIYPGIRA